LQCHTPPCGSTLFAAIKDPRSHKEEEGLLLSAFAFWGFTLGFWYGKLLEGKKLLKGKR
jgi:hypothetical protein